MRSNEFEWQSTNGQRRGKRRARTKKSETVFQKDENIAMGEELAKLLQSGDDDVLQTLGDDCIDYEDFSFDSILAMGAVPHTTGPVEPQLSPGTLAAFPCLAPTPDLTTAEVLDNEVGVGESFTVNNTLVGTDVHKIGSPVQTLPCKTTGFKYKITLFQQTGRSAQFKAINRRLNFTDAAKRQRTIPPGIRFNSKMVVRAAA